MIFIAGCEDCVVSIGMGAFDASAPNGVGLRRTLARGDAIT
jgi:hypothetical protein